MELKLVFQGISAKNIFLIKFLIMKMLKKVSDSDKKLIKEISLGLGKIILFHMVNRILKKYGLPTIVIKMLSNGVAQLALSSNEKLTCDDLKPDDFILLLQRFPSHVQDYIISQISNVK